MQTDKVLKKVHKEKALVLSSALVTMLLLGVGEYFLYLMIKGEFPYVLGIGFLAVFVATLVISYGYAPMSVELSDQSLTLYRGIGKKVFKFSEIKNVEVYISNGAVVRTCGGRWSFWLYRSILHKKNRKLFFVCWRLFTDFLYRTKRW